MSDDFREIDLTSMAQLGIEPRSAKKVTVPVAALEVMREWTSVPGACLVFVGPFGTGKSQLARVAEFMFRRGWEQEHSEAATRMRESWDLWSEVRGRQPGSVRYSVPDLFETLRRSYDDREVRDPLAQCVRSRLLILDDLAAERPSEWVLERLFTVIDERYAQQRPMIVTTNKPVDEMEPHVGGRVMSRLAEMTGNGKFVVHVGGPDRRQAP